MKELLLQALSMQHDTVYDLVLAKLHSYDRDVLIAKWSSAWAMICKISARAAPASAA